MTPATPTAHRGAGDDIVVPFRTVHSRMTGRLVRLGTAADRILTQHGYPEPVSVVLGQAIALTAMLGTALKFEGKLILQTKTDGPLSMLVAQFETPGQLRGYASFDRQSIKTASGAAGRMAPEVLLGAGHLAMTIDPSGPMDRYQGIVALEHETLSSAALTYFRQSEQLPTFLRLAVARHFLSGDEATGGGWHWRAGGLMVQHLTSEGGLDELGPREDLDDGAVAGEDDEDWRRVRLLAETVQDHELLDPTLAPQQLLYRLFHEEGVRVGDPHDIDARCSCSRDRVAGLLTRFGAAELRDMREHDGSVAVTCEFCNRTYRFTDGELV